MKKITLNEEVSKIREMMGLTESSEAFRAGDLITKAEPINKFRATIRGTGHFGTGFYFFGDKESAQKYAQVTGTDTSSRIISKINLDDYNLAPASLRLHNTLKNINDSAMSNKPTSITTYDISTVSKILGVNSPNQISTENPYKEFAFRNNDQYVLLLKKYTEEEIDKGSNNYMSFEQSQNEKRDIVANEINEKLKSSGNTDTPSTLIMKALGFEGVNAIGTPLDNAQYGTVIYDIK